MLPINFYCSDADTDLKPGAKSWTHSHSLLPSFSNPGQGNLWHTCGMVSSSSRSGLSHSPGHIWRHIARFYRIVQIYFAFFIRYTKPGHIELGRQLALTLFTILFLRLLEYIRIRTSWAPLVITLCICHLFPSFVSSIFVAFGGHKKKATKSESYPSLVLTSDITLCRCRCRLSGIFATHSPRSRFLSDYIRQIVASTRTWYGGFASEFSSHPPPPTILRHWPALLSLSRLVSHVFI